LGVEVKNFDGAGGETRNLKSTTGATGIPWPYKEVQVVGNLDGIQLPGWMAGNFNDFAAPPFQVEKC